MTTATIAVPLIPRSVRRAPCAGADAKETERLLLVRYHEDGDLAAREELVERFLPLARDLALRYSYTDEPVDDLLQVASLGLIKAIDRFEPGRGTKFTSYAAPTILGELKRHFRDKGWSLHVPRDLQERSLAVSRATEVLSTELGRSPKVREVANHLGCSVEQVLEAQEAAASYEAASLDAPAARDDGESASLVELLGSDDAAYDLVEDRQAIASTWLALPEVERKVVELRFMHDLTQREIGEQIGYSQMHVSRLLRRALNRLETAALAA
ncbi:MAG TPA: SigB/SigF/SigG family RNA polymerase sigma factor [Thermoleophilaceae bacterium]